MGDNIQFGDGASKEHYTLCRCGASQNKPFCDGMHRTFNFKDDKNYCHPTNKYPILYISYNITF